MEFTFELTVDRQHVKEAVKALLYTIFFYRTFGSITASTHEFLETPYPHAEAPDIDDEIERQLDVLMTRIESDLETPILSSTSTTPFGSPGQHFNLNSMTPTNPYANIKFEEPEPLAEPPSMNNSRTLRKSPVIHPKEALQREFKFSQVEVKFHDRQKLKKPTWFGKLDEDVLWETWKLNLKVYRKTPDTGSDFFKNLNDSFAELVMKISDAANEYKDHIPIITNTDVMPFTYIISVAGTESWKGYFKKMLADAT
ncbi:Meiotically up-regulated gene 66 protein [Cyberlindnera fabianii]|uniref:Autophagy-related protein 101 n=1 Tax=Cyberlindnera fabianii TaxID=36022 RepID=A0A1V2LD20_CYBFA|nr:Meiotically up-regulated gene 66 protein [Cyberlindnera fabianii]